MKNPELKPIERATYIHCCIGGPWDGTKVPSKHCYFEMSIDKTVYVSEGDPEPCDPGGIEVLHVSEEYWEDVFFKVKMVPKNK